MKIIFLQILIPELYVQLTWIVIPWDTLDFNV